MNTHKTLKFAKVFSLKTFPPYEPLRPAPITVGTSYSGLCEDEVKHINSHPPIVNKTGSYFIFNPYGTNTMFFPNNAAEVSGTTGGF